MQRRSEVGMVRLYLRGQNLEQLGRVDEAVTAYEEAVTGRFDSPGPYDRLIYIYADRASHGDVIRIAEAALANVRTYEEKKGWYRQMRAEAEKRLTEKMPKPIPRSP